MEKHVKTLGVLWIAKGILGLFVGVIVFVVLVGVGFFASTTSGEEVLTILSIIAIIAASVIVILSLPSILAGIGILKKRQWGRILGIIVAALNLVDVPLGTALGIYSFWVLLNDEAQALFDGGSSE